MKPSDITKSLVHLTSVQRPAMIWGAPGVGKSDIVAQVAAIRGVELRDVRLSLMDPTDIKGFPKIGEVKQGKTTVEEMRWIPPDFLPHSGEGILFLDELVSAPRAVQAAAYQLILNRCIGKYKLPDGWSVIAAGNRMGDRAVVHDMPSALANRFVHIEYEVDMEDWYAWATTNKISDVVRSWIRFKPTALHSFDPNSSERAFPSPRSWVFVDDLIRSNLSPDTELELIKGTVGEGAAAEFMAHMRMAKDLPTADMVLLAPETAPIPESPAGKYAICSALDGVATKQNLGTLLTYVERMTGEYQVLFVRSAALANNEIMQAPVYTKWLLANKDLLK